MSTPPPAASDRGIQLGFLAAAAYNVVGIAISSRGFTSAALFETDPLFSFGGCIVVALWGLAYAAQALTWRTAPAISAVFALEKAFFTAWWASFMLTRSHELPALAARDPLAAAFYGAYGIGDGLFMLFFAAVAWKARQSTR